jgi:hypothetical protein
MKSEITLLAVAGQCGVLGANGFVVLAALER